MFFKKKQIIPTAVAPEKPLEILAGIEINVMPSTFFKRRKEITQKPAKIVKPAPVIALPVTLPPVEQAVVTAKKKSRFTIVFSIVGVCIVLAFGITAVFVIKSLPSNEIPVVEEEIETNATENAISIPTEPEQGVDTDSDGLTDAEEKLYGTSARNPDTDGDTFLDGNEVFHRYSPLEASSATLLQTGVVIQYDDQFGDFHFDYPNGWTAKDTVDEENKITTVVNLETSSSALIRISLSTKEQQETFEQWYTQNVVSSIDVNDIRSTFTKQGYEKYASTDERTVYLVFDMTVFIFTYDLSDETAIEYLQTFAMLINSFIFKP